jgi:uncharacterized integral membrane protein
MSEITREELAAFTEASTKSAVALEKVSESLERISSCQEKLVEKVGVIVEDKLKNAPMAKDIEHTKWLVGIVGFVIIVVTVIFRVINVNTISNSTEQQTKIFEQIIHAHERVEQKMYQGGSSGPSQPVRGDVQSQ